MKLNDLRPIPGSNTKASRVGRGRGSGSGKTAGRGTKGQKSRSGGAFVHSSKVGRCLYTAVSRNAALHNKRFAKHYITVNVGDLMCMEDGSLVDAASLAEAGVISLPKVNDGLKVFGRRRTNH